MSVPNGYNPMQWDCSKKGCFNIVKRPKIELFADLLPGKISFGDIDAIVEINGRALALEWKDHIPQRPGGQGIMHKRLSRGGMLSFIVVVGDAQTMEVSYISYVFDGSASEYYPATLRNVREAISSWVCWAQSKPWPMFLPETPKLDSHADQG